MRQYLLPRDAVVAQLVEHLHGKEKVSGSIPDNGSMGRYRSGQTGQTVNLLAYAFEGSNPSLPTMKIRTARATLAQLVEQHFCKVKVPGSIPGGGSTPAGLDGFGDFL